MLQVENAGRRIAITLNLLVVVLISLTVMLPVYSQNNAKKKKAKDEWKTKGNANIDSTKHFLGTRDVSPLIFKTNSVERMRITSSGLVGIGTPTPTYPFDVQVPTRIKTLTADFVNITKGLVIGDLHLCRGNSCNVDTIHTTQQRDLLLRSSNLLGLIADTVKIASQTSTGAQLKIAGSLVAQDIYLSSGVSSGEVLVVGANGKVTGLALILDTVRANLVNCSRPIMPWRLIESQALPPFILPKGSITYIGGGNVGIGTCVPSGKLHVKNDNVYTHSLFVEGQNDTGLVVSVESKVGIRSFQPEAVLDINSKNTQDVLLVRDGAVPILYVGNNGRVGIGTKNPVANLEIVERNSSHGLVVWDGINAESVISFEPQSNSHQIAYHRLDFWEIDTNWGVPVMSLNDMGLGIGTFHPEKPLHIFGTSSKLRISDTSSVIDIGLSGSNGIIEYTGSSRLLINYNSGRGVEIGGNVGIGTAPVAQYRLNICGKVRCEEVRVQAPGWCDYVFEPDYELMSWDDLMQYINENKHLPGVPSADEVEAEGIPVGEMHKILLQKIEELVLYNDQLRREVKELREEVESLKKERNSDVKNQN